MATATAPPPPATAMPPPTRDPPGAAGVAGYSDVQRARLDYVPPKPRVLHGAGEGGGGG
jgi:hypothetical protein